MKNTKSEDLIKNVGWLKIFEGDEAWKSGQSIIKNCEDFNIKHEILNADELQQLEPNLAPIFKHAIWQPDSSFVISPQKMLDQLFALFLELGGSFEQLDITEITPKKDHITLRLSNGETKEIKELLVAAGGWSNKLLKTFGQKVHLEVERGYHAKITHTVGGPLLSRPTLYVDHRFVMAPMEEYMRLTCQVELAEIDSKPDYTRLRCLFPMAKKMLPKLTMDIQDEWMGSRPTQPDSVPTIGKLPNFDNVTLAFGHHHLGFTMAAVTGEVVADIYANRPSKVDLEPYRAIR